MSPIGPYSIDFVQDWKKNLLGKFWFSQSEYFKIASVCSVLCLGPQMKREGLAKQFFLSGCCFKLHQKASWGPLLLGSSNSQTHGKPFGIGDVSKQQQPSLTSHLSDLQLDFLKQHRPRLSIAWKLNPLPSALFDCCNLDVVVKRGKRQIFTVGRVVNIKVGSIFNYGLEAVLWFKCGLFAKGLCVKGVVPGVDTMNLWRRGLVVSPYDTGVWPGKGARRFLGTCWFSQKNKSGHSPVSGFV